MGDTTEEVTLVACEGSTHMEEGNMDSFGEASEPLYHMG